MTQGYLRTPDAARYLGVGQSTLERKRVTVSYEKHEHQHVHMDDRGDDNSGGRYREPNTRGAPSGKHEGCPSLPRPHPPLVVMPVPGTEGEEALPTPRRKGRAT